MNRGTLIVLRNEMRHGEDDNARNVLIFEPSLILRLPFSSDP